VYTVFTLSNTVGYTTPLKLVILFPEASPTNPETVITDKAFKVSLDVTVNDCEFIVEV